MSRLVLLLAATALAGLGLAHVQLVYQNNGNPLSWSNPTAISVVIQEDGSDNVPDASDEVAIRNGIAAWNAVEGTTARLVEVTTPSQRARTDFAAQDLHTILFDENNSSGYFPSGSGTVALRRCSSTPPARSSTRTSCSTAGPSRSPRGDRPGASTSRTSRPTSWGTSLGLDHSGVAGSTMFPYVDSTVILHRSLSTDDAAGIRSIYPSESMGRITGTVQRADGSVVAGAHVTARDASGRTAAAALGRANGTFTIEGLESGTYEVVAHPFDHPVGAHNVSSWHTIQTDFGATSFGFVTVTAGDVASVGAQTVAADTALVLGRSYDDYPQRVTMGQSSFHIVRGAGLIEGSTLTASDPRWS